MSWRYLLPLFLLFQSSALPFIPSIAEPEVKWSKKSIVVCWGNDNDITKIKNNISLQYTLRDAGLVQFSNEIKSVISTTITEEYSISRTGIEFIGWKNCSETNNPDLIIFQAYGENRTNESFGESTIGEHSYFDTYGYHRTDLNTVDAVFLRYKRTLNGRLGMVSTQQSLQMTAIHEFGHVAGLRHEHVRIEAKNDANCITTEVILLETLFQSSKNYTTYDSNSIMSYCYSTLIRKLTGLDFCINETGINGCIKSSSVSLKDETLITKTRLKNGSDLIKIKIGLSNKDIQTLKALYN